MVAKRAFNPSTWEADAGGSLCELEASLVYMLFQDSQWHTGKPCLKKLQKKPRSLFLLCDSDWVSRTLARQLPRWRPCLVPWAVNVLWRKMSLSNGEMRSCLGFGVPLYELMATWNFPRSLVSLLFECESIFGKSFCTYMSVDVCARVLCLCACMWKSEVNFGYLYLISLPMF